MEDAQELFETSQVRMSRYLDTSTTTQVAQFIVQPFFPVVLLERNLYGPPLWEKVPNLECLFLHRKEGSFFWEESRISLQCRRNWWNLLILMNQHHLLTTYIWDAPNVNANWTKLFVTNTQKCSNHEFLLKQLKNYQGGRSLTHKLSRRPTTCVTSTPTAHTFFSCSVCLSVLVPACCRSCPGGYSHIVTHWPHAHAKYIICVLHKNCHTSSRNVIRYTSLDYTGHVHSFLIFDTIFPTYLTSTCQRA